MSNLRYKNVIILEKIRCVLLFITAAVLIMILASCSSSPEVIESPGVGGLYNYATFADEDLEDDEEDPEPYIEEVTGETVAYTSYPNDTVVTITKNIPELPAPLQPIGIASGEGDIITDEGFRIEVVYARVYSNILDVYFTLLDLVSDRIRNGVFVPTHVGTPLNAHGWRGGVIPNSIIYQSDDGVLTLHHRSIFPEPIRDQEIRFSAESAFRYNFRTGRTVLDIDLSTAAELTPTDIVRGVAVLPINTHPVEAVIEGYDESGWASLSSIGIVGGRLHMQYVFTNFPWEEERVNYTGGWSPRLHLINPHGEVVEPFLQDISGHLLPSIQFQENQINDGNTDNFVTIYGNMPTFVEIVYEVDLELLAQYKLVADFRVFNWLSFSPERIWFTSFEITGYEAEIKVEGLNIELENIPAVVNEIIIRPFSLVIDGQNTSNLRGSFRDGIRDMSGRLNMADGSAVDFSLGDSFMGFLSNASRFPLTIALFDMHNPHLVLDAYYPHETFAVDLSSVVSIEIAGQTVDLRP